MRLGMCVTHASERRGEDVRCLTRRAWGRTVATATRCDGPAGRGVVVGERDDDRRARTQRALTGWDR